MQEIGRRAKERRCEIGMSLEDMAIQINKDKLFVARTEYRFFVNRMESLESDWEKALSVPPGWLRNKDIQINAALLEGGDLHPIGVKTNSKSKGGHRKDSRFERLKALQSLGIRARQRRAAMEMPIAHIIESSPDLSLDYIRASEVILKFKVNAIKEGAWENALMVPPGWLRNTKIKTPQVPNAKGRDYVLEYRRNQSFIGLHRGDASPVV